MTRRFELCSGPVSWGAPDDRLHLCLGLPTRQEEPTQGGGDTTYHYLREAQSRFYLGTLLPLCDGQPVLQRHPP